MAKGAPKSSKLRKTETGQHVSAKNRSGDPACSQAASAWVLGRKAGSVAAGVYKILAACRAKVRQNQGAALKQSSGKLAAGRGTWQRSEKARALMAKRAAGRPAANSHMAADAHATKAAAAQPKPAAPAFNLKQSSATAKARPKFENSGGKTPYLLDMKAGDLRGQTSLLDRVGHDTFKRTPTAAERMAQRAEAHGDTPGNRQRRLRELLAARKARTTTTPAPTAAMTKTAPTAAMTKTDRAEHSTRAVKAGIRAGTHGHPEIEAHVSALAATHTAAELKDLHQRIAGVKAASGKAAVQGIAKDLHRAHQAHEQVKEINAIGAPRPAHAPVATSAAAEVATGKASERVARVVAAARPAAGPEHVRDAILGHANHLLREEHGHTGLIPIHQIRDRVEAHLGPVPHGDFDRHLNDLRREGKLRMLPGTSRDTANPEHARKSFAGTGGDTWFYVEQPSAPGATFRAPAVQAHAPGAVRAAIAGHAARLRGEKYHATGLVPIHEVRAAVRRDLGPDAASHEVFDRHVLDLHRDKAARLLPINDATHVSAAQMNASIPGGGQTWFYLEHRGAADATHAPLMSEAEAHRRAQAAIKASRR